MNEVNAAFEPVRVQDVYIVPGEQELPISEFADTAERSAQVRKLTDDGFACARVTRLSPFDFVSQALHAYLNHTRLKPGEVDAVIFSTDSLYLNEFNAYGGDDRWLRRSLFRILVDNGFKTAFPYLNSLGACGNLGSTLAMARGLVASGAHRKVLVILADVVRDSDPRLMQKGVGVYSDAVGLCTVSAGAGAGYRLNDVILHQFSPLFFCDQETENLKYLVQATKSIRQLAAAHAARLQRVFDASARIIGPNLIRESLSILAEGLAIGIDRIERPSRTRLGHANSVDQLASLALIAETARPSAGGSETFALINPSPYSWTVASLTADGADGGPDGAHPPQTGREVLVATG